MSVKTKCRRCSECRSNSHHWIEDIDDNDPPAFDYSCKHCEQKGHECPACYGFGNSEMDGSGKQCKACNAEGVLPVEIFQTLKAAVVAAAREIIEHWDEWAADAGHQAQIHQMAEVHGFVMESRLTVAIENAVFACWASIREMGEA